MKEIQLTNGQVALVDDADFDWLSAKHWQAIRRKNYSLIRWVAMHYYHVKGTRKVKGVLMHRVIMDAQPGQEIDHIDRNPLNNQRSNLRFATRSQNGMNKGVSKRNKVGYKGVFFRKSRGVYLAQMRKDGKKFHLGSFRTPLEAARAYNEAAKVMHGEYACLNDLEEAKPTIRLTAQTIGLDTLIGIA